MQKFRQRILQRFRHHHLGGQDIGANRPYPGAKILVTSEKWGAGG